MNETILFLKDTATLIILLIPVGALVYTTRSYYLNKQNKIIDLTKWFHERYHAISFRLNKIRIDEEADARYYYLRYWNLQLEQFQYFRKGFVDINMYMYWLRQRNQEYAVNNSLIHQNVDYRSGWNHAKSLILDVDDRFIELMEKNFNAQNGIAKKDLIKYIKKRWYWMT